MKPQHEPEDAQKLYPELQRALRDVGPQRYAKETARDFAKGGKYNTQPKRQKYALT